MDNKKKPTCISNKLSTLKYPFASCFCYENNGDTFFLTLGKLVKVEGLDSKKISILLQQCNGHTTTEDVLSQTAELTNLDINFLIKLIADLYDQKIIIDVHAYYQLFHIISSNPMPYFQNITKEQVKELLKIPPPLFKASFPIKSPFEKILSTRKSTRDFKPSVITKKMLNRLVWSAYGKLPKKDNSTITGVATIPSGGALFPLNIYLIIFRNCPGQEKGIYNIRDGQLKFVEKLDSKKINQALCNNQSQLSNANFCIVITSSFKKVTQKYSNRGYRHALIESGHIAQNIYLFCSENGLGTVEISAFNDELMAQVLDLDFPYEAVVNILIIGNPSTAE